MKQQTKDQIISVIGLAGLLLSVSIICITSVWLMIHGEMDQRWAVRAAVGFFTGGFVFGASLVTSALVS